MSESRQITRRSFLTATASAAGGLLLAGCAGAGKALEAPGNDKSPEPKGHAGAAAEPDVTPVEDLMREHGVLRRILLIYGEAGRRMDAGEEAPIKSIAAAAAIVRAFVQDYHETLEERFLFPRFGRAGTALELVETLRDQHEAGRVVTETTVRLSAAGAIKGADDKRMLGQSLIQFIRMYGPHAAREDTVLFPAFRELVPAKEYDALGDAFEKKENELFGDKGFERMVDKVAAIERELGIYDLKQFTPKA